MAKNSTEAYGASGKTNVLNFEPERLHLVTDRAHPLYDERIHLPLDEAMVLNIMDQGYWSLSSFGKTLKPASHVWSMVVSVYGMPLRQTSDWQLQERICYSSLP